MTSPAQGKTFLSPAAVVVVIVIAAAFVAAGPAEQSLERLCTKHAPTAQACLRL